MLDNVIFLLFNLYTLLSIIKQPHFKFQKMQYEKKRKQDEMDGHLPSAAVSPSETDNALLSANGLLYRLPQSLSTTNFRNVRKQYADRTLYSPGDVMRFVWNTGTSYIDPATAFISFRVNVTQSTLDDANNSYIFGNGCGAANLISEILIQSKNGKELDRVTNVDKLAAIRYHWLMNTEAKDSMQVAGVGHTFTVSNSVPTASLDVSIPLSLLSGFFRPIVKGTKIPASLASGLLIQMTCQTAATSFKHSAVGGLGKGIQYSITDPEMYLQSSELNDPTQSTLLVTSAESGLDYVYTSTYTDTDTPASNNVNQVSKKAVSQCLRTYCCRYPANHTEETVDGYTTAPASEITAWQWRLGSSYFPQNVVDDLPTSYMLATQTFDKQRALFVNPTGVPYDKYQTDDGLIGVPVNSESRLLLSGAPLNNSNVLELQMNTSVSGRFHVVWMEYIAVAKCFLNYTDLKI